MSEKRHPETMLTNLNKKSRAECNLKLDFEKIKKAEYDFEYKNFKKSKKPVDLLLLKAIRTNNILCTQQALEEGARVDIKSYWNTTPLHLACRKGTKEMVKLLLEHGAGISLMSPSKHQLTPLEEAIKGENTEVVHFLVEQGVDVNYTVWDEIGCTPLGLACNMENLTIVKLLVEAKADLKVGYKMHLEVILESPPLILAMRRGSLEIVEFLLQIGANPNEEEYSDPDGPEYVRAIDIKVEWKEPKLVELLIRFGAWCPNIVERMMYHKEVFSLMTLCLWELHKRGVEKDSLERAVPEVLQYFSFPHRMVSPYNETENEIVEHNKRYAKEDNVF